MKSSVVLAHPQNKCFITTFQDLYQDAQRRNHTSQAATYRKILQSLRRYPLPLRNASQALFLDGVGKGNACLFAVDPKVSGIESPSTAEDSESHRRRLLNAMKEFASTITLPEIIDALPKEKEKARKCSLRLSPGTSGWTILLSVYLFSHQFETQELRQVDVVKAVEILSRYDPRCKVSSWKAALSLVDEEYLTSRDVPVPLSCKNRNKKHRVAPAYKLTERGKAAGEAILCTIDAPLIKLGTTAVPFSATERQQLPSSNDASSVVLSSMPSLRDRLMERLDSVAASQDEKSSIGLLPDKQRAASHPISSLSSFHFCESPPVEVGKSSVTTLSQKSLTASLPFASKTKRKPGTSASPTPQHTLDFFFSGDSSPASKHSSAPSPSSRSLFRQNAFSSVQNLTSKTPSLQAPHIQEPGSNCTTAPPYDEQLLTAILRWCNGNEIPMVAFQVVCLIDSRETHAANMSGTDGQRFVASMPSNDNPLFRSKGPVLDLLEAQHVTFETTPLAVGDFAWVCRFRKPKDLLLSDHLHEILLNTSLGPHVNKNSSLPGYEQDIDFVLPYIVERKTVADFVASIIDGRYEDQKFRLLRSTGIERVIFIIEGSEKEFSAAYTRATASHHHSNLNQETLLTAIVSTQLINGFQILFSSDMTQTAAFLTFIHKTFLMSLTRYAEQNDQLNLKWCSAALPKHPGNRLLYYLAARRPLRRYWDRRNRRLTTAMDVFGKQLRSMHHVGERAVEFLLRRYEVPASLHKALERWPTNREFCDAVICSKPCPLSAVDPERDFPTQRNPLTTNVMTALREVYAPSTVESSLVCGKPSGQSRRRKKDAKRSSKVSSPNASQTTVKKRVEALRKKKEKTIEGKNDC